MRKNRYLSAFTLAACGVLVTSATAAAAMRAPALSGPAARAPATAASHSAKVFFTAYQDDEGAGATVILSGAIGDFGEAASVNPNGSLNPDHTSQLNLALIRGSFRITFGPLHRELEIAESKTPFNLKTCSGHVSVTGQAPIVAGSGTGIYKGITGGFMLTIAVNEVGIQPCQPWQAHTVAAEHVLIAGPGTVSLTGGAVAGASTTPVVTAGAPAAAAAAPGSGKVYLTVYHDSDLPGLTAVLSGAIGDLGAAAIVTARGTVNSDGTQVKLALTHGSFRVVIGPLERAFQHAATHAPFSLKTCSGHATATGTVPVIPGSGTGAYKGITGSFTLTITGNEVLSPPCQRFQGSGPAAAGEAAYAAGPGNISVPHAAVNPQTP
jgi:hypothetical protein